MRIAMVIAPKDFRDEEFFIPYEYFKEKGYEVDVFSTEKGLAKGSLGKTFNVEKSIDELSLSYDALVFAGGPGVPLLRNDERVIQKVKDYFNAGKLVAAICWSPTILAKAGVLKGKKATVWKGFDPEYGKMTNEVLEESGATYTGNAVEVDGNIITGNGPRAALSYAKAIDEWLSQSK